MPTNAPRAVFVVRDTDYELLLSRHATREQARFFLKTRGQDLAEVETRHEAFHERLKIARAAVPGDWRSTLIHRGDLDRFLFAPEDIVIAFGQDGLVANAAKYLSGQPVVGVNPHPDLYDGILVPFAAEDVARVLKPVAHGDVRLQRRTMVEARLDDGQKLLALNEIFVGHQSHQSARYELTAGASREYQSSSGLIVASGTGATGWARSIREAIHVDLPLSPEDAAVEFFVREPFPSVSTGTSLRYGKLSGDAPLTVASRMNDGGVIFADGIEQDRLNFTWGQLVRIGVAERRLHLVSR